jgi:thioredoxin-dependent peroxiredoxin
MSESYRMLETGDSVADVSTLAADGVSKPRSAYVGTKGLIVYFYPKDNTPGCTREACSFRDNHDQLKKLGYGVVGVSGDSAKSHQKFIAGQGLNFPLLADETQQLQKLFGAYGEKQLYGRSYMGTLRSTFVLDARLQVVRVYPNVKVDGHVEQILSDMVGVVGVPQAAKKKFAARAVPAKSPEKAAKKASKKAPGKTAGSARKKTSKKASKKKIGKKR